jgi:GT2 family glycosyltransferase
MKILIAIPTFESIYPDTYQSVWNLEKGGHDIEFWFARGYDCATARNNIAQHAIDIDADYVLMVDNDVVLPTDTLVNLLDDPRDVCLGYYAHRNRDNRYTGRVSVCKLGWYNYPLESEYTAEEMAEERSLENYKIRIHGGGMGCALIRTDVFRKIQYPWYDWVNYSDENRGMLSEDLYFCEQCKHAGIPVFTDSRAGCGHLFRYVQWPE